MEYRLSLSVEHSNALDTLARVCNLLGHHGLVYDKNFVWERFEYTVQDDLNQFLVLTFTNHDAMLSAKLAIESSK